MYLSDIAYTILATFYTDAYHLYNITYDNELFDCNDLLDSSNEIAAYVPLSSLSFQEHPDLQMNYDFGSTYTFHIHFDGIEHVEKRITRKTPIIMNGIGFGIAEDCSGEFQQYLDGNEPLVDSSNGRIPLSVAYPAIKDSFVLSKNQSHTQSIFSLVKDSYEHHTAF